MAGSLDFALEMEKKNTFFSQMKLFWHFFIHDFNDPSWFIQRKLKKMNGHWQKIIQKLTDFRIPNLVGIRTNEDFNLSLKQSRLVWVLLAFLLRGTDPRRGEVKVERRGAEGISTTVEIECFEFLEHQEHQHQVTWAVQPSWKRSKWFYWHGRETKFRNTQTQSKCVASAIKLSFRLWEMLCYKAGIEQKNENYDCRTANRSNYLIQISVVCSK